MAPSSSVDGVSERRCNAMNLLGAVYLRQDILRGCVGFSERGRTFYAAAHWHTRIIQARPPDATAYDKLGRKNDALRLRRDVYSV